MADRNNQQPETMQFSDEMLKALQKELNRPFSEVKALADALTGPDGEKNAKTLYLLFSFFNEANKKAAEQGKELSADEQTALFQKVKKDFLHDDFKNRKPVALEKVDFPVDKVNNTVWALLALKKGQGNHDNVTLGMQKHDSEQRLKTYYSINFDELEKDTHLQLSKQLEPFDKRVYMIVSALFNAGNSVVTVTQVCKELFGGKPNNRQIERVDKSLMKMERTRIEIDNKQESDAYNYPYFRYRGYLLPVERIEAVTNGKTTDGALHLFREPPLMEYARGRKQLTTVQKNLIQSPLSRTDETIQIEDYLIERIARAKKEKKPGDRSKILLETLYQNTNTKKERKFLQDKVIEKVRTLLAHFVECEYIQKFSIDECQGFILIAL